MNTSTTEPQQAKKVFTPALDSSHDDADDQQVEKPQRSEKRTAAPTSNKQASVTSLRENAPVKKSEEREEVSAKEPTLVDNLDLALMNASISIGDWVKKIEALTPKEGAISQASKFTVGKLQAVQNYIGDNGSKDIAQNAWQFVRRSPLTVGLAIAGAGLGLYLTRNAVKAVTTASADVSK